MSAEKTLVVTEKKLNLKFQDSPHRWLFVPRVGTKDPTHTRERDFFLGNFEAKKSINLKNIKFKIPYFSQNFYAINAMYILIEAANEMGVQLSQFNYVGFFFLSHLKTFPDAP